VFFYVARQPILNESKAIYGYELLFRDGPNNSFPNIASDEATIRLVEGSEFNAGVKLLTDNNFAFVNFSESALLDGLPSLLPTDKTVIELLEDIPPTPAILEAVQRYKGEGYQIALDDFEYHPGWHEFLPYVDIIKVDFRAMNTAHINQLLKDLRFFTGRLLAEKIETYDEYQQAKSLGFTLFQGYFFARPELIQKRVLSSSQAVCMRLLELTSEPNYHIDSVAELIEQDIGLTYKLLKFVNSAFFRRQSEINSIQQAIVRLGQVEIRKFSALIAAASLADGKPDELIKLSFIRARFMELLAQHNEQYKVEPASAFLTGVLSKLDAMMDNELTVILSGVAIAKEIKRPLIEGTGPMAFFLRTCEVLEQGNWTQLERLAQRLRIKPAQLIEYYQQAQQWGQSFAKT